MARRARHSQVGHRTGFLDVLLVMDLVGRPLGTVVDRDHVWLRIAPASVCTSVVPALHTFQAHQLLPGMVEGNHQVIPEPLAQRIPRSLLAKLSHETRGLTCGEIKLDAPLQVGQMALLQPR